MTRFAMPRWVWERLLPGMMISGLLAGCGGDEGGGARPFSPIDPKDAPVKVDEIAHEAPDECDDGKDNDEDGFEDCDDLDCRAESDECQLAPEVDRTVPSTLPDAVRFLFADPDPVQKELDEEELDLKRLSVVHGRVVDADGKPLRDVKVSVQGHSELGFSMSRADGRYDFVVNGGGAFVLQHERQGYIEAARWSATRWQEEHTVADVGLVRVSPELFTVELGKAQVVRGEQTEDDVGERQPFLVFAEGTEAEAVLKGNKREALSEIHLRITAYPFDTEAPTVPGATARFAPGTLPSGSAFSYSIEFSVEEAEKLRASRVEFSKPVAYYVENFLGLPVGSSIPLYSYDRPSGQWETLESGTVIGIVDVRGGRAEIDLDGDGEAEDDAYLEFVGVAGPELVELGSRFEQGDSVWRHSIQHFSAFTDAWRVLAPSTAVPPEVPSALKPRVDNPTLRDNIRIEDGVVNESVSLVGTPFSLVYQTDRSSAYGAAFHVTVPLLGDTVPSGLESVYLVVDVAGRLFPEQPSERRFDPKPKLDYEFVWDGSNAMGQLLQGEQKAKVWIGYGFRGTLSGSIADEALEGPDGEVPFVLPEATIWRRQDVLLGLLDAKGFQFGGFGLDAQHAYDPAHQILYFGDGNRRTVDDLHLQVVTIDRPGSFVDASGESGDLPRHVQWPDSIIAAPDGGLYVSDDDEDAKVWHITREGEYEIVLGKGASGAAGEIELLSPQGLALDPVGGLLYVTDWKALKVYFLLPSGEVGVLLGDDSAAMIRHELTDPDGLADRCSSRCRQRDRRARPGSYTRLDPSSSRSYFRHVVPSRLPA